MKKITAVLAAVVLVVSMASLVFAAGMEKGTIKSVNEKARTVVFCPEGTNKDVKLKAEKSVDLSKIKAGDKVEASIEKHMLKHVMTAPAEAPAPASAPARKAPVGC